MDPFDALSLAANPIRRFLGWITLETRVVRRVRKDAAHLNIKIDSRRLRATMYDSEFKATLAHAEADPRELDERLSQCIQPNTHDNVSIVRRQILEAFSARLPGSSAYAQFTELQSQVRHDQLNAQLRSIAEPPDSLGDQVSFPYRMTELPPIRAEEFRHLNSEWPLTARVVAMLSTATTKADLIRRWNSQWPLWFNTAPPELFGLIADFAGDDPTPENIDLTQSIITYGLGRGLEPRAYWLLRHCELSGESDQDEAARTLTTVRGYPLVEAFLHMDGFDSAILLLEEWAPDNAREELHRRLLLAQIYQATGRLSEAIEIASAAERDFKSTAASLQAATALINRHRIHASNQSDLADALTHAVTARARRRYWGLPSGEALAVEIRARRTLLDLRGALAIANGVSENPASSDELKHPAVIRELALIQAEFGDVAIARRLANEAPLFSAQVHAIIAERENRADDARASWREALESTDDIADKAHFALQLAFHGEQVAYIDELGTENEDTAAELTLIADLKSGRPGALEEFRGYANETLRGTLILWNYYGRKGDDAAAAAVAREGAAKWSDPDLWLACGRYNHKQKLYAQSIEDITNALSVADKAWGSRAAAFRHLIEVYSMLDDWHSAKHAAAQLLAAEPENTVAAWAMIICQLHTLDVSGALHTWRSSGSPEPESEQEAGAWVMLLAEYGAQVGNAVDALAISARFATSETIRTKIIGALIMPSAADSEIIDEDPDADTATAPQDTIIDDDSHSTAFQALIDEYLRDFPDGEIKRISIDEADPLKALDQVFADNPQSDELDSKLHSGALPVGLASDIYGKSYLEILLERQYGPVHTGSADDQAERRALTAATNDGVVLDLSTLVTIARLPTPLHSLMINYFANSRVLAEHRRDAHNGARLIRMDSGLSYRPGQNGREGHIVERSPEYIQSLADLAATVTAYFSRMVVDEHAVIVKIEALAHRASTSRFALSADLALTAGLPLWVDDRAIAEVVRSQGGMAFDTPSILEHMRSAQSLSADLIDTAEALLVTHGYTGVRFSSRVWHLTESLAENSQGILSVIRFGGSESLIDRVRFGMEQIEKNVTDPLMLTAHILAIGSWLLSISVTPAMGEDVLRQLAADLLQRSWVNSSTLPSCASAFKSFEGIDGTSMLLEEIFKCYRSVSRVIGEQTAASRTFELVSHLDAPDAYRVRAAVLAGAFT